MSAMDHFSPFAESTYKTLGFLSMGLEGKMSVTIRASKNGLTLRLGDLFVARGKDARAMCEDYERKMTELGARLERLKKALPKS